MRIQFSILVVAVASQLGATDCGQVLRDPGFDLWCGDKLCTWKIVRGDAKRVDTWHEGDSGVELVGADAAIAQLTPVNHGDGTCIQFDFVANVGDNANARLDVDVYGDGSVEKSYPIPAAKWQPVSFKIRVAKPFTGIRFELAKTGSGKAVFANIGAEIATGCDGVDEIPPSPAPLGALCLVNSNCKSNLCRLVDDPQGFFGVAQRCVACDVNTCGSGEACGVSEPVGPVLAVPIECVAAGADELGEQCVSGAECASGICTNFACSACGPADPCTPKEVCGPAWLHGPNVCAPGQGLRASGEACGTDADCTSGRCNGGARNACEDNRPCFSEANCPVTDGLVPGACTTVGVQGGSCN